MRDSYWAENHEASKSTIVCSIKVVSAMGILYNVEVLKIFYASGSFAKENWGHGDETSITDDDIFNEKEILEFVFNDMRY